MGRGDRDRGGAEAEEAGSKERLGCDQRLPDLDLLSVTAPTYGIVGENVQIPFSVRSRTTAALRRRRPCWQAARPSTQAIRGSDRHLSSINAGAGNVALIADNDILDNTALETANVTAAGLLMVADDDGGASVIAVHVPSGDVARIDVPPGRRFDRFGSPLFLPQKNHQSLFTATRASYS